MDAFRLLVFVFSAAAIASCSTVSPSLVAGAPRALYATSTTGGRYAYVSDTYANLVYVYAWSVPDMKRGTYLRSIRLTQPLGGCADGQGDVYITHVNDGNGAIVEYRGDSGDRLRHLDDPGNIPFSCAVDPASGDIAVANVGLATSSPSHGSVWVYPGGSGPPVHFVDLPSASGTLEAIYFVAYDGGGKLYADGSVAPCHHFTNCGRPGDAHIDVLTSCCSASSAFVPVTLEGYPLHGLRYPGALIWEAEYLGGYLLVGDRQAARGIAQRCVYSQGCAALYAAREGGSPSAPTLVLLGELFLDESAQAWGVTIGDGESLVPHVPGWVPDGVQVYSYPEGGSQIAGWEAPHGTQFPAFVTISE